MGCCASRSLLNSRSGGKAGGHSADRALTGWAMDQESPVRGQLNRAAVQVFRPQRCFLEIVTWVRTVFVKGG